MVDSGIGEGREEILMGCLGLVRDLLRDAERRMEDRMEEEDDCVKESGRRVWLILGMSDL